MTDTPPNQLPIIRDSTVVRLSVATLVSMMCGLVGAAAFVTIAFVDISELKASVAEIRETLRTMQRHP